MRLCDLKPNQIKIGMRIKSIITPQIGTIVNIDQYGEAEVEWNNYPSGAPCSNTQFNVADHANNEIIEPASKDELVKLINALEL